MFKRAARVLALLTLLPFLLGAAPAAGTVRRVYNLTLTSANTEYSLTLTGRVYQLTVQCRTAFDVKMGVASGTSGSVYFTIKSGDAYYEQIVQINEETLYFQSTQAGVVVEVITWGED